MFVVKWLDVSTPPSEDCGNPHEARHCASLWEGRGGIKRQRKGDGRFQDGNGYEHLEREERKSAAGFKKYTRIEIPTTLKNGGGEMSNRCKAYIKFEY
jgi:hypothetical protein